MIICSITPVDVCEWMYDKSYVMLLSSAAADMKYRAEAVMHPDCYKILKNDVKDLSYANYYQIAETLEATEVVLLDEYRQGAQTIAKAREQIEWLRERNLLDHYTLQVVLYAESLEEFKTNLATIAQIPEIKVVGLPKVLSTWCTDANRAGLIELVHQAGLEAHLLGFWYSLKELLDMPYDTIMHLRSADTTLFALNAINCISALSDRQNHLNIHYHYSDLSKESYEAALYDYYRRIYEKALKAGRIGE